MSEVTGIELRLLHSHFMEGQVWSFRLYRGEDHHAHRLILLCFSLSHLPVLSRSLGIILHLFSKLSLRIIIVKKEEMEEEYTPSHPCT